MNKTWTQIESEILEMKDGDEAVVDYGYNYLFPLKNYKTEEVIINSRSMLKIKKIANYKEKIIKLQGFDPEIRPKQPRLDEYQKVGLSKNDFI